MAESNLICVVDDDPSMGRMLARGIRAAGFDVALYTSAEEFLDSGRIVDAVCLILDIDLPGMSGTELHQRLRELDVEIPVIMISGHADAQTRARVLQAGAIGFFNKPFSIDSLLATIQTIEPQMSL